jgi:butyrate kinase
VEICYSGVYSQQEMSKKLAGGGGLVGLLGTNDAQTVEKMIRSGDEYARTVYEAMAYQVAKEIGGCAAVLSGKVDRIILTGGLAFSEMFIGWIIPRVKFIAPVMLFPGESELEALAQGALRVMENREPVKEYV